MPKNTITNNRPGGFGIPCWPVIAGNGGTLEVEQNDWDTVKDSLVVKALLEADYLCFRCKGTEEVGSINRRR